MTAGRASLGWAGILRLGLVQAALGGIVVFATSTLNRIMVVEAALPAVVPGILVGLHYALQTMRPRLGHGSDVGGRRTPWIMGGMAVLALGLVLAACATALMADRPALGISLAAIGYGLIGLGVGCAGTTLLVLLAALVDARRRAAAATVVWMMMIAGFAVTAGTAGHFLEPYSPARLVGVAVGIAAIALVVAVAAVWGVEGANVALPATAPDAAEPATPFRQALGEVWGEPRARRFALFVFVSMLAYSAQNLILEPFAGAVFGLSPGATTQIAGVQHAGLLVGMALVAVAGLAFAGRGLAEMRAWCFGGCAASALAALALAAAAVVGPGWPLGTTIFLGGVANGAFAIAAIAAMMQLVGSGRPSRAGVRMGLWGAAQAVAFGLGGLGGAASSDLGRFVTASLASGYGLAFLAQALLFLWAAFASLRVFDATPRRASAAPFGRLAGGTSPSAAR